MPRSERIQANGLDFHVLRAGQGPTLVLLHGWPEFARVWEPLMQRLSGGFTLIAPDFRGFGESDNSHPEPSDAVTAEVHAGDVLAILDALDIGGKVGLISHDVGSSVAQAIARGTPERVAGLFFFNLAYRGIGSRALVPEMLKEIWYQSFHQKPWAAALVGQSRESVRIYISAFLRHWSARPDAFDPAAVELWTDNFLRSGNLQGGFNWYIGENSRRLAMMRGDAPVPPPIAVPTRVLWGAHDPVLKAEWRDRLPEFFTDLEVSLAETAGHFVHWEEPDLAADTIRTFFDRLPSFRAA